MRPTAAAGGGLHGARILERRAHVERGVARRHRAVARCADLSTRRGGIDAPAVGLEGTVGRTSIERLTLARIGVEPAGVEPASIELGQRRVGLGGRIREHARVPRQETTDRRAPAAAVARLFGARDAPVPAVRSVPAAVGAARVPPVAAARTVVAALPRVERAIAADPDPHLERADVGDLAGRRIAVDRPPNCIEVEGLRGSDGGIDAR